MKSHPGCHWFLIIFLSTAQKILSKSEVAGRPPQVKIGGLFLVYHVLKETIAGKDVEISILG